MRSSDRLSRRGFLAAAAALPLATWARAATPLEGAFDDLVRKEGVTADGPGVAVLVRRPGQVVLQRCTGLARLPKQAAITPRTTFELASLTKPFTATAVLMLHDRGKLSIHDDVRKYVPEVPVYAEDRPIALTDLLQHTSGLPDYMRMEQPSAGAKKYLTNEDYLAEFARQREKVPHRFVTGEKYEYSNTNYMLLALIIARVAKKSFGTFLRDEVLGPAGMKHSFVYEADVPSLGEAEGDRMPAIGYGRRPFLRTWEAGWGCPPVRRETLLTVGDGGLWTNLDDMAKWDDAIRGDKLLKPDTMKLALTPSKTRDGTTNTYGLGWVLSRDPAGELRGYGHNGSWGGFKTSYHRNLANGRTTVILSNRGSFGPDKFRAALDEVVEKHKS